MQLPHEFKIITITIPNSLTDIAEFRVWGSTRICVEVAVATNALADFDILFKSNSLGSWIVARTSTADYASAAGILVESSGDLNIIAAGASGYFFLDTAGIHAVKIRGTSANAGGSAINVYASAW